MRNDGIISGCEKEEAAHVQVPLNASANRG